MTKEQRLLRIKLYIDKMPSLPTTVAKILEITNDPRTSPADLNRVISLDPVLMGKVMKLINSAYYGLNQEITSLVRAIIMLGLNTVKNLALSTAVLGTLGKSSEFQALNMEGFWRHSLCVGVTSKLIAKKRKVDAKSHEEYFIAGLLHDIGKIPLNNKLSEDYIQAMSYSDQTNSPLYKAEKETMEMNHSEIGQVIVKLWKLDSAITDAIGWHHHTSAYKGQHKDLLYSVAMANHFANTYEIGFSGDRYPEKVDPDVEAYLGMGLDQLEELEDTVNNEIQKASIFLKLAM